MKAILAIPIATLLTACSSSQALVDSSCRSFKPIAASKSDTEPTKRQIIGHNKAYDAICPGQGTAPQKLAAR